MRVLIIDDEPDVHFSLSQKLKENHPALEVVGSAYNIFEGKQKIEYHQPELVFLDIGMPDGTGFDLLSQLAQRTFYTIFITAFNQFAQTAIRMGALDYLLKPIDSEELNAAIQRAQQEYANRIRLEQLHILQDTLEKLKLRQLPLRMSIATHEGILFFPTEKVIRLEAMQNFTEFIVDGKNQRLIASYNLGKYETDLKPYLSFVRVHKSHLINIFHVVQYHKGEKPTVDMTDGQKIPVSRKYRPILEARLKDLL